jgi:hypothetical protein
MTSRDILSHEEKKAEISRELTQLFIKQREFFRKGPRHSAEELRNYEAARRRVRELFAELERLRQAA